MTAENVLSSGPAKVRSREGLLQEICQNNDLLSMGSTIARVVSLASDDEEALSDLVYLVLSDVALTQKILRLANTVFYRSAAGARVTTVSKAIFLLGFDTVKTSALAMLLVDGLTNQSHARSVRAELSQAVCASVLSRELARKGSAYQGAEEAAIAALFKNLGRVLVASHAHAAYSEIMELADKGGNSLQDASEQIMGCSFESLASSVLQKWKIPDTIIRAALFSSKEKLKSPQNRQEWMQHIAAFGSEAGLLISGKKNADQAKRLEALQERFGESLNLDKEKIQSLLANVEPEVGALADTIGLDKSADQPEPSSPIPVPGLPSELLLLANIPGDIQPDARHPDGKPVNARERLLVGIQDVTQMIASGRCKVNELMLLVLETLYNSMGFRFAALCLKDRKTNHYIARVTLGEKQAERQTGFTFPASSGNDLFQMAMQNDVDLMISDSTAPNISGLIPSWHRKLFPDARSFIVLSLVVDKIHVGFYYADRTQPTPDGVPPEEISLIKILKSQVMSMLQKR